MEILEKLHQLGFDKVSIIDAAPLGYEGKRLVLLFAYYRSACPDKGIEPEIHPYYPVSQRSYLVARAFAAECRARGMSVELRDDIALKPVFAKLSFLRRGKNTLSYLPDVGSRFHVQCLLTGEDWPLTDKLTEKEATEGCEHCRNCVKACPLHAITEDGFIKERCLRYWMLSGKLPPQDVAGQMGSRFIGCDNCQVCCPMNPVPSASPERIPLQAVLTGSMKQKLAEELGTNLALPNRLLVQGCVIAGATGRKDLRPELEKLCTHPSPAVENAAKQALCLLSEEK